ncbi:RNA-directed DNA polymerase [Xanthomonas melonis]|uniref:RNA-directed DNA polymerase n=1 Tax=Xanthomonas melonis TaxID=56456 RepID=UPI003EBF6AFB
MRDFIEKAIDNVARFGDTDIFPFDFERHVLFDRRDATVEFLLQLHDNFEDRLNREPPDFIKTLVPVGYTGFRWATKIEPFWNVYYLALVLKIAAGIERERIPVGQRQVFSYRYAAGQPDGRLFSDCNWRDYRRRAAELAAAHEFVAVTDIADFYPRIYHHRIDNAIRRIPGCEVVRSKILKLLMVFSGSDSYGLPVGGPASRLLAELALNDVDQHLNGHRIKFCRYADDYTICAMTKDEAHRALVSLAEKLSHEGLTLQKSKTRVMTREEYLETVGVLDPCDEPDSARAPEDRLLSISVRFDPYSPNAADDYEALRSALREIDIVGILGREVAKASIDPAVARHAISAVAVLDAQQKNGAVRTLLDGENILVLAPVFLSVMRLIREVYDELESGSKDYVDEFLVALYENSSHVLSVDVNLAFYVQALSRRDSNRKREVLIRIYETSRSWLVRRQVFSAMLNLGALFWLREQKRGFRHLSDLERRSMIVASYWLSDEGGHWRRANSPGFTASECLIRDWFTERWAVNKTVPM